jgi:hypothetical protein
MTIQEKAEKFDKMPAPVEEEQLYLNLKNRYAFDCPHCGKEHYAAPSIAMECLQANTGRGHCLEDRQKESFRLAIDDKNERMTATITDRLDFNPLPEACYATKENLIKNEVIEK